MSSQNPPYPYFNGITYNSSFFGSTTSSLTQGEANLLYLKKTVPDTSTVLETFSGGILTNNLNTLSTSGALQIGASTNTGTIAISTINTGNTNASPAISIGSDAGTKTIKINNNTNSVHCSSLDFQSSSINNIVNDTGSISIGDKQTAGQINIGVSSIRNSSSLINIGTGINTIVNTNVIIGSSTCTTRLNNFNQFCYNAFVPTIPSYINCNSGGLNTYLDFFTGAAGTLGLQPAAYDARILAYSGAGSGSDATASLNYYASSHNFQNGVGNNITLSSSGITLLGDTKITLGSGATVPSLGQLGYTNANYLGTNMNLNTSGTYTTIINSSITSAGVYIVSYSIKFISTSTNAFQIVESYVNLPSTGFAVANQMIDAAQNLGTVATLNNVQFSGTWCGPMAVGTLSLITYATYSGVGTPQANANISGGTYLTFTRIA